MTTFTKEQLQQIEAAAKEVLFPVVWSEKKARAHFSEKITPEVVLKLARIALASLEAEPYGYLRENDGQIQISIGPERPHDRSGGYATPWAAIYAAPQPLNDAERAELQVRRRADNAEPVAWDYEWASCITCEGPQNFKRVIEREAPPEWAVDEGQAKNITLLYAAPPAPVVPNGWIAVPIEPTEDMIIAGFESAPNEDFSEPEEWEAYAAMSGCQQAAHKARLCWDAMIAAAPEAGKYE